MKIVLFALLLGLLFGCAKTPSIVAPSIVELRCAEKTKPCAAYFDFITARPELFEARKVRVYGYSRWTSTGLYLFEQKEQILSPSLMPSIALVDPNGDILAQREKLDNKWLDVTGTFKLERNGSQIYWFYLEVDSFRESNWRDGSPAEPQG